jgi:prepilin-type N-terminal cleavage/methylation domain-containing protein
MRHTYTHGFTLIEVSITIAIILTLATITLGGFFGFATTSGGSAHARTVLSIIETARSKTLSGDLDTNYGVHFSPTVVTLFQGDTYNSSDPNNTPQTLSQTELVDITLSNGAQAITFERLTGRTSATGTVTMRQTNSSGLLHTIVIHETGLVEILE